MYKSIFPILFLTSLWAGNTRLLAQPIIDFDRIPTRYPSPCLAPSSPPLTIGTATFSNGFVIPLGVAPDNTRAYLNEAGCNGQQPTIVVNFANPVSNISFLLVDCNAAGAVESFVVTDNNQNSKTISFDTRGVPICFGAANVSLPWKNVTQLTITDPVQSSATAFAIDNIQFTAGLAFADPVPQLVTGVGILNDPNSLAQLGVPISAVAADSAVRVLLQMQANQPNQSLTITLLNDTGSESTSPSEDGQLGSLQDSSGNTAQLTVTASNTALGPMAFAVYFPPADFDRGGIDDTAARRSVSFVVTSSADASYQVAATLNILRPPVFLLHGLWDQPSTWDAFLPLIGDPRFFVRRGKFDKLVHVSASNPIYACPTFVGLDPCPGFLAKTRQNSIGLAYNAPLVRRQVLETLFQFRGPNNAAAAQVDIVGHSMGGVVARFIESLPEFTDANSFGRGTFHKLITIGTPHLGNQLSAAANQFQNLCTRSILAYKGKVSLVSATIDGVSGVTGATGDLQGDGTVDSSLSAPLLAIQLPNGHPVPTGLIVGSTSPANLAGLTLDPSASALRGACKNDPLASNLTPTGWAGVFGFGVANDAAVPVLSQSAGSQSAQMVSGVIHSGGFLSLGFNGPTELDAFTFPGLVINYLNMSLTNPYFHSLP